MFTIGKKMYKSMFLHCTACSMKQYVIPDLSQMCLHNQISSQYLECDFLC